MHEKHNVANRISYTRVIDIYGAQNL